MKIRIALIGLAFAALCSLSHAQSLAVDLKWSASASSTAAEPGSVQLYRAFGTCAANPVTGASYKEVATIPGAPTGSYQDATVTDGATYCYYVTATMPSYSAPSSPSAPFQVTVVLSSGPSAPSGLTATVVQIGTSPTAAAALAVRRPKAPTVR